MPQLEARFTPSQSYINSMKRKLREKGLRNPTRIGHSRPPRNDYCPRVCKIEGITNWGYRIAKEE